METINCSLREKKQAKTKLAIMDEFIKRLEKNRFEDISIREICKAVEISEGTFFNYFSEKISIVGYYVDLMILKIIWKAKEKVPPEKHLKLVNAVFEQVAEETRWENVLYQVIAVLVGQKGKPEISEITSIEKQLFFSEYPGIEESSTMFIGDFFRDCLKEAVKQGELPHKTNIDDVLMSLLTILVGTLLSVKVSEGRDCAYHYGRQLRFLWEGLGVKVIRG